MIREVKFESQDRRIKQILAALNENGIKDIEEANAICDAAGIDPYKTCEELSLSASRMLNGLRCWLRHRVEERLQKRR